MLHVSRQAFYDYLKRKGNPWKYQYLVDEMNNIINEDLYNDTYGRYRMHRAFILKHENDPDFYIPGERTIYRIMAIAGLSKRPRRKPNGITKADKNARKSDDLIRRDFKADRPLQIILI